MSNFIVVREYKATPPPPEGSITILKKEAFDPTGYSFLRTNENGMDEWVPTDRLDYYRGVFGITEEKP